LARKRRACHTEDLACITVLEKPWIRPCVILSSFRRQNIAAIQHALVKLQSEVAPNKIACKKKVVESDTIEATDTALFTGMMV
jgi:hypothetical protein